MITRDPRVQRVLLTAFISENAEPKQNHFGPNVTLINVFAVIQLLTLILMIR